MQDFAHLDARGLYGLLCEIDEDEGFAGDTDGIDAHRWLHATYAVAARDGTPAAHRAYMQRARQGHATGEAPGGLVAVRPGRPSGLSVGPAPAPTMPVGGPPT